MSPQIEIEFAILAGIEVIVAGIVGWALCHYGKMNPTTFAAIIALAEFTIAIGGSLIAGASAKMIAPLSILGTVGAVLYYSSNITGHNS